MLSIEEARFKVFEEIPLPFCESVELLSARGRVLEREILAPADLPGFDNTAMDGYALRSQDTAAASPTSPVALRVTQEIQAAGGRASEVGALEAARIFTGAAIPPGADAVEIQENARREGEIVYFDKPVPAGKSIRMQGEYLRAGQVLLPAGSPIEAGEIALLASIGRTTVEVRRRPTVALLSCGDELVEAHQQPGFGQLYESNRYALSAQILEAGGIPLRLPLTPDQPEAIEARIREAMQADILLSSGGVSVGDYDLVRPALEACGVQLHFWKVAIKPGKPLVFGRHQRTLVFGLPGNPGSSMVTFELFVRPVLRRMLGFQEVERPVLRARLTAPARPTRGRTHFVRGHLHQHQGEMLFEPYRSQGSGNLLSMRGINGYARLAPGSESLPEGSEVEVLWLASQGGLGG